MIHLDQNKLLQDELCLLWDGVRHEWRRILFFNNKGQAVEVQLTPTNPKLRSSWEPVGRMIVRQHCTFNVYGCGLSRKGDRLYRYIVRNRHSIIFNEIRSAMMKNLPMDVIQRLLYWDFLPQVDWDAYMANQSGGGCAFSLCKMKPRR